MENQEGDKEKTNTENNNKQEEKKEEEDEKKDTNEESKQDDNKENNDTSNKEGEQLPQLNEIIDGSDIKKEEEAKTEEKNEEKTIEVKNEEKKEEIETHNIPVEEENKTEIKVEDNEKQIQDNTNSIPSTEEKKEDTPKEEIKTEDIQKEELQKDTEVRKEENNNTTTEEPKTDTMEEEAKKEKKVEIIEPEKEDKKEKKPIEIKKLNLNTTSRKRNENHTPMKTERTTEFSKDSPELTPTSIKTKKYIKGKIGNVPHHKKTNTTFIDYQTERKIEKKPTPQKELTGFDETYQRFQSKLDDYKAKMEMMRKKKKEDELKALKPVPRINKNTDTLFKSNKTFLQRQESFEKKRKEKQKKTLEEKKRKEEEELKKKNSDKKKNKKDFSHQISQFQEWENKKKEHINELKKKKEEQELKELTKVTKKKKVKVTQRELDNAIERLYKDDVNKRKQNQHMLKTIFTPSFTPQINRGKNIIKTEPQMPKEEIEDNENVEEELVTRHGAQIENVIRDKLFRNKKISSNSKNNEDINGNVMEGTTNEEAN